MSIYIAALSLPLILILYLQAVFTWDMSKIKEKSTVNNEVTTSKILSQNMVPSQQLFSFHSELGRGLRDWHGFSYSEQLLKKKTLKRGTYGFGFPSLEASLLSLAFLTFAVYLVNLIQDIITTIQGNYMA